MVNSAIFDAPPNIAARLDGGLLLVDARNRILDYSKSCEQLLGFPPEEVMGQDLRMLFPDLGSVEEAPPRPGSREDAEGRRKDGRRLPLELHFGHRRVQDQTLYTITLQDPSLRARGLEDFFNLSGDMLCIATMEGHTLRANPAAVRTLGYSEAELRSRSFMDFLIPEEVDRVREELQRQTAGKSSVNFEVTLRSGDGSVRQVLWNSAPDPRSGLIYASGRDITEIRSVQAEHSRSMERSAELAERLRSILDASRYIILDTTVDGTVREMNTATGQLLGYSAEEIRRPGFFAGLYDPAELAERAATLSEELGQPVQAGFEALVAKARRVGSDDGDWVVIRKDGSRIPIHLSVTVRRDKQGEIAGFLWVAADISEKKGAEAKATAVFRELNYLKLALDQHAVVSINNARGEIVYVNDRFCSLTRYTRAELLGQNHRIFNSGWHPPEFFRDLWVTVNGGRMWKGEIRNRAKDGGIYWMDTTIVPVPDDHGKLLQYVEICTDITERKLAEEALARKHQELEVAARIDRIASRIMVALSQHDGDARPGAEVLQVLAEEAGYRPLAFYELEEGSGILQLSGSLSLAGGTEPKRFRLGEGLVGEAALRCYPIFVDQSSGGPFLLDTGVGILETATLFALPLLHRNKVLGVIAGASRVRLSERERSWLPQVAAQVAIGLHALTQYQEVRELSRQLNERNLKIEAQNQELGRANRLKSEFLASMSHELRTPLNAIIGFSEVLKDGLLGELPAEPLDYIKEIFQSGHHLLELINDILDLSKIEAGKMELEVETVEIGPLVSNALTIVRKRAEQGGVSLQERVEPGLSTVEGDPRKLRQIIYNLLSNAVKFTPRGGLVTLEVRSHGPDLEFVVSDTGIGISPENQGRLFRAFEQLDGGLDRKYEGTGLGLVMVRSLAELHGGTAGAESEPGKGSRFWVIIPKGRPGPAADPNNLGRTWSNESTAQQPRVLVVDDDPTAVKLAGWWLGEAGYTVEVAVDCESAWRSVEERPADVILLDILFSQQDEGWRLLERLKESGRHRETPVVVVSIVADAARARAMGAVAVLQKPVSGPELVQTVQSFGRVSRPGGEQSWQKSCS